MAQKKEHGKLVVKATTILTVSILVGFFVPAGLGAYHNIASPGESYHLFYMFPSESARPIIFYYGGGGIAKIIDPNTLGVTIGLTNSDRQPHMIGFKLEDLPQDVHVHWSNQYSKGFNEEEKRYDRVIGPYSRVNVHLTFFIEGKPTESMIYNGYFEVYDLNNGATLLKIPVKILNEKASGAGTGGDEECH